MLWSLVGNFRLENQKRQRKGVKEQERESDEDRKDRKWRE